MRITNAVAVATVVAGLIACSDTSSISSPNGSTRPALAKGPKSLPGRGPMLFAASVIGDRELYSVNEDGTGLKRLTFSPGYDDLAAYSPDGSKIVFVSNRTARNQMYVMNGDGTAVKQITNFTTDYNVAGRPTWSPDGKKIVTGLVDATGPVIRTDVFVMSPNGMIQSKLTSEGTVNMEPTVSPDGQRIAFVSNRDPDGLVDIWIMDADGSNPTRLTNCEAGFNCRQPAWAPDGSKIAYTRMSEVSNTPQIVVTTPNGSELFKTPVMYHDPFWSPDAVKLGAIFEDVTGQKLMTLSANGTAYASTFQLVNAEMRPGGWSR